MGVGKEEADRRECLSISDRPPLPSLISLHPVTKARLVKVLVRMLKGHLEGAKEVDRDDALDVSLERAPGEDPTATSGTARSGLYPPVHDAAAPPPPGVDTPTVRPGRRRAAIWMVGGPDTDA